MNLIPENIDFEKYAELTDEARIRPAVSFTQQVADNFWGHDADAGGCALPWDEQKAYVRPKPGKVSLWTGVTHHGKSTALCHAMAYALAQGEKVCVWSGEETPDVTLETMLVQATMNPKPSRQAIQQYLLSVGPALWFYDQLGVVGARRLLGVLGYAIQKLKTTHFVIDSLMKTAVRTDDYDGQKEFINELAAFARYSGCHVHVVAHMRKGKDEGLGSIMDVKGAGEIINQVDNIFLIWKNKAKQDAMAKANPDPKLAEQPDTVFAVEKQRGRKSWTGKFNLSYHPGYLQFTRRNAEPKAYFVPQREEAPL